MPALAIFRRDLVRLVRTPIRTALMFAVPLVIATMLGLAFGGDGGSDITIVVLVQDDDDTMITRMLTRGQLDPRLRLVSVDGDGEERLAAGEASALLRIPAGFTDDYLRGRTTSLTLVKNPAQRFLPRVIEEAAGFGTVVLDAGSRIFRSELAAFADLGGRGGAEPTAVASLAAAVTLRLQTVLPYVHPPLIGLESVTLTDTSANERPDVGLMSFIFPGLAVLGILFLAQAVTRDILREREAGLVRHLLTAPVSVTDYLVGKTLSVVLITIFGFTLLVAIGSAIGVTWGPPLAVAALVVASAIAAGGALVLIMSLVSSERQQDAVTTIVLMTWALVGGSIVPLDNLPSFLLPISRSSLNYWSVDGFNTLILRGGGLAEITVHLAVLAGLGTLFLAIGMRRLRHHLTSGAI